MIIEMNEKAENKNLGIYIHIPFCVQKCRYCDFCSFPHNRNTPRDLEFADKYVDELCSDIKKAASAMSAYNVDTVYLGGGTPTLLSPIQFEKLFKELSESANILPDAEISIECNPATADEEYLKTLRGMGVNRLSIGFQSANERELCALGRVHTFYDAQKVFDDARNAGFDNVSVDVMYGIPEQTEKSFSETLNSIIALAPEHISSYCLKLEEGTPLFCEKNRLSLPSDDAVFEMYSNMAEKLASVQYERYEISNFAKRGYKSRHNLKYWTGGDYLGFGMSAHSYFQGERFSVSSDAEDFFKPNKICDRYFIEPNEKMREYIMLRMRLEEGIDADDFEKRFGANFCELYGNALKSYGEKYVKSFGKRISFTTEGMYVSNYILSEIIDFDT